MKQQQQRPQQTSSRATGMRVMLAALIGVWITSQVVSAGLASFVLNRPRLFQRGVAPAPPTSQAGQQQQQQQHLQPLQPEARNPREPPHQLMLAANNMLPNYGQHFGQHQQQQLQQHGDLLRLHHQQQHQHQQPQPKPIQHELAAFPASASLSIQQPQPPQQPDFSQLSGQVGGFEAAQAAYYKPAVELAQPAGQQHQFGRAAPPAGLQQSQTEQVVDKIERHIGEQIEHSLGQQEPAASGYEHHEHQHHEPAKHAEPKHAEEASKEQAASGGQDSDEGGADEISHEEPAAEKRHHHHQHHDGHQHEEHKPQEHNHEHHEHHHHHPEAFEVHHKKGGKSFQYFHQGHHH